MGGGMKNTARAIYFFKIIYTPKPIKDELLSIFLSHTTRGNKQKYIYTLLRKFSFNRKYDLKTVGMEAFDRKQTNLGLTCRNGLKSEMNFIFCSDR